MQRGLTIGRASSNTIVIDHPDLDRIHARVLLEDDGVFRLACEPQAPRLQVLEPESGEVEKVEIQPGLAITLGGITIRCRRQVRGMMGVSDEYWAEAAGGERFQVESDGFKGSLPKKIGPYEIRGYVARGGMGIVLQGLHEETAHLAAVKLPTPDLNRDVRWLRRFEQEVQTLKSLVHPNLVRLQDAGKQGALHWMAMDWVEGGTVAKRLADSRAAGEQVPLPEIKLIIQQVVTGLEHLHWQGVVHRDLKPGNLLMGQDGSVKVADFGLAKQVGTDQNTALTRTGTLAGTMHYMAPEQAEGLEVTTATDIYALGIIWHELLTGKRPGGGRLKLQRFRSDSPAAWESVMEDCLDREAAERPGLDAIRQALESVALKSEIEKEEKHRRKEQEDQKRKETEEFINAGILGSPVIGVDGTVYFGTKGNSVYALNGKTGAKKWEFITEGWVLSSPAIGEDGTVYIGSDDKSIYALDGKTGAKKWEVKTDAEVRSDITIGSDGMVYVGSNDKKVYAIKTDSNGPAKSPWPMRGQNAQHTGRVMK